MSGRSAVLCIRCRAPSARVAAVDCGVCGGMNGSAWPALAFWRHRHYRCPRCPLNFAVSA